MKPVPTKRIKRPPPKGPYKEYRSNPVSVSSLAPPEPTPKTPRFLLRMPWPHEADLLAYRVGEFIRDEGYLSPKAAPQEQQGKEE